MKTVWFDVVIPVYNAREYITECIDSVLNQSFQNLNVILVDDGSTDGSEKICDDFAFRFPEKVRVIHTRNQGALMARREGISRAKGDYLVFLDADDCLRRDALEVMAKYFVEFKADMVLYHAALDAEFEHRWKAYPYPDRTVFYGQKKRVLFRDLIDGRVSNSLCLKTVKRAVFDRLDDYSQFAGVKHGEDLLISALVTEKAERIVSCDQKLYFYRQHPGSVTTMFDPEYTQSIRIVHTILGSRLDEWGISECRKKHNARIVRSWIRGVREISDKRNIPSRQLRKQKQQEYAEDDFFRRAYQNMDSNCLSVRDRMVAHCLYRNHYRLLSALCGIERM